MWIFRSRAWKAQVQRVLFAIDPASGLVREITLTNGGVLAFRGESRLHEYALEQRQDPVEAISRIWGFRPIATRLDDFRPRRTESDSGKRSLVGT